MKGGFGPQKEEADTGSTMTENAEEEEGNNDRNL